MKASCPASWNDDRLADTAAVARGTGQLSTRPAVAVPWEADSAAADDPGDGAAGERRSRVESGAAAKVYDLVGAVSDAAWRESPLVNCG